MAKKKNRVKRKLKKKSTKESVLQRQLIKIIAGLAILAVLVVLAGLLTQHFMSRLRPALNLQETNRAAPKAPPFEIYPPEDKGADRPLTKPKLTLPPKRPKVAIIIDDLGYDQILAEKFLALDTVLTFSILPHSPFQGKIAGHARDKGVETILHLPMEPREYPLVDPGPGTLLTSMSPDELIKQLEKDLSAVPFIKGVNNHMGSKMTSGSTQMYQILSILKKKGFFFIDSRTTPDSLCKPSARLLQVPFAQRDIFLDHVQDPEFIRNQLEQLVRIADRKGEAIGIAHPHSLTYDILREELPNLQREVQLVPVSQIVHPLS